MTRDQGTQQLIQGTQKGKILVVNLSTAMDELLNQMLNNSGLAYDMTNELVTQQILSKACSDAYDTVLFASAHKKMRQHMEIIAQLNHVAPYIKSVVMADKTSTNLLREKLGDMAFQILPNDICLVQGALTIKKAAEQTRLLHLENLLQRKFYAMREGHAQLISNQKSLYKLASSFNVLREFIESMGSLQKVPQLLAKVLESMEDIFGSLKASVFLINPDSGCLELAQGKGLNSQSRSKLIFRPGEGIAGWCATNRKSALIDDPIKDPRYTSFGSIREDRMSLMAAPLLSGTRCHGVLCVESNFFKNRYNTYDFGLFEILAAQVAITLENMRIIDDIRSVNINLEEKIRELNTLFDINAATVLFIDQEKFLSQVIERTTVALKAKRCAVLLRDRDTGELVLTAGHGIAADMVGTLKLRETNSISGMVARIKKPVVVNDLESKPEFKKYSMETYLKNDLVSVPILYESKAIGVICVSGSQLRSGFRPKNRDLLVSIASTVAQAITNHWDFVDMMDSEREKAQIEDRFKQYVAPKVVDQIVDHADLLDCRRREVTIIMSDVSNFTPISEAIEAETIVTMLNTYFDMMTDIVFSENGTIDKFIGDAVYAIFGAPVYFPDHAERAVKAAVQMLKVFQAFKKEWIERDERFAPMDLKVAIGTGEALVGNIGSRRRMEFTSFGEAPSICEQLEDIAKAGQILIDEDALSSLKEAVPANPYEGHTVTTTSGTRPVFNVDWRKIELDPETTEAVMEQL